MSGSLSWGTPQDKDCGGGFPLDQAEGMYNPRPDYRAQYERESYMRRLEDDPFKRQMLDDPTPGRFHVTGQVDSDLPEYW